VHVVQGRGHSFLKHIERTNLFMFVVDIGGFQLSPSSEFRSAFETVQLLVKVSGSEHRIVFNTKVYGGYVNLYTVLFFRP